MRLLFAGSEPKKYRNILLKAGAQNGLESYWSLGQKVKPAQEDWPGLYLLDSGGFSARVRGVKISVKEYAQYLNKHKVKFAFNLDPPDNHESLQNLYYLQENTDTYIIPIFHGQEYEDSKWRPILDYYIDNYPFIALGGIAESRGDRSGRERFFDYVFSKTKDKVAVHGLGTTQQSLLKRYPFYCVDSTSWMQMMRFGSSKVYSKKMAKVKARKNHYTQNIDDDIQWWLKLEADMTKLWLKRGVNWSDVDYDYCIKKRTMKKWDKEPKKQ